MHTWKSFVVLTLLMAAPAYGQVMFGSGTSDNATPGGLGTVDPTTGIFTAIGDPTPDPNDALSGLVFDNSNRLFGSVSNSLSSSSASRLIEINPSTGALINTIGPITVGMTGLRIVDLALQPSTNTLFAIDKNGALYTVDKTTAAATSVGSTGLDKGGIAFAPDGTLYLATASQDFAEIDPSNGQVVGPVTDLGHCMDGLAVRPTDGTLFATECDGSAIYAFSPVVLMPVEASPDSDQDASDLAFQTVIDPAPAPAMSSVALAVLVALLFAAGVARVGARSRLSHS